MADPGRERYEYMQAVRRVGHDAAAVAELAVEQASASPREDRARARLTYPWRHYAGGGALVPESQVGRGRIRTATFVRRRGQRVYYCASCGSRIDYGSPHWVDANGIQRLHLHCGEDA